MEKETLIQAVATIGSLYGQIADLLKSTNPVAYSATDDIMRDAEGVKQYVSSVLTSNQFTESELNLVLGVEKGFGRHLSDVEQTVYEEIGGDKLDQLRLLMTKDSDAYKTINSYLKAGATL